MPYLNNHKTRDQFRIITFYININNLLITTFGIYNLLQSIKVLTAKLIVSVLTHRF